MKNEKTQYSQQEKGYGDLSIK